MPSQLSRQSVRLLTDWSQVRALSMALLGPQLSQVERPAHNRKVMGSNPIGPMLIKLYLQICSGGVVRPIISAFRAEDSGSNPGRSILKNLLRFLMVSTYPFFLFKRGCPRGQRGQAQDLLTQVYQGSNPCSRTLTIFLYIKLFINAGVGQAVILRDCGSRDSGSNLGSGPIYKNYFSFSYYFSNALSFSLYMVNFKLLIEC